MLDHQRKQGRRSLSRHGSADACLEDEASAMLTFYLVGQRHDRDSLLCARDDSPHRDLSDVGQAS